MSIFLLAAYYEDYRASWGWDVKVVNPAKSDDGRF